MYIFTWKIARIHTSYTESLASCSYIYIYTWIILDNYGWLVVLTIFKHISQWEGWHPIYEMENTNHVPNHQSDGYIWAIHGSLNVPIFHITQPWMVFLVFFMAIFSGDVQYTKMGQLPTPAYGLYMGHIPSDPSQRRLHLQGDLLARGVGRRDFDRCGARRFGGRGRGGVWPWWRWDIGGYEQLALAIWAKYITINMKKSVGPFTVKIYHNWMGIYTKYLGPYSVGIEMPKYITICWNNSRLECEKDGVSLESVQWGRKIWLLAQALSTWVALLILGI